MDPRRTRRGVISQQHRVNSALPQGIHREAVAVDAGLPRQESQRRPSTVGVHRTSDVGGSAGERTEAGGTGADLVVSQGRHTALGQELRELTHVADGSCDIVVTVAVGLSTLGDQQRGRAHTVAGEVAVGTVQGQSVDVECHVLFQPDPLDVAVA